jgi:hypothetical protein
MKNQHFKLINGTFSAEEAKEILTNVYGSKIQFHLIRNWSSSERFGHDDPESVKRLPELRRDFDRIKQMLSACDPDLKISISSTVQITIDEKTADNPSAQTRKRIVETAVSVR